MLRSLLLDFNAFFASVEQWLNPAWRGLPLAVVPVMADSSCCIAASYEARAFGVKTGTRVGEARALCPGLVLVQAEHHRYVRVHEQALGVLERVAPIRQVLSIDEMEFELTGRWTQPQAAAQLGRDLKAAIRQEFGPTLRRCV